MKTINSKFGRGLGFILLFLSCLSAQAKQPNIVFILVDDLSKEVFSHSDKINSLITAHGANFDNHLVNLSLCCPSRVTTLRGQYAHNTGIYDNKGVYGGFHKVFKDGLEKSTIATWLQAAGYRTALFGKYLNGYPNKFSGTAYIPPGWSYWVSPNQGNPYSEYDYSLNENGITVSYGAQDSDYLADVLSNHTANFIRNSAANYPNTPFFIYLAPYLPHEPATPPSRYRNDLRSLKAPRPASFNKTSFNEADVSDKPSWVRAKRPLSNADIYYIDRLYRKQRLSMKTIGDMVENLINTLRAVDELDNTYIFFTSDNGYHLGEHRLTAGKNTAYEEDIKIPLVVRGPGIRAGEIVTELTANVDIAPTLAEIAGITPPTFVDGRSLFPFLTGSTPPAWRKALLLEHKAPSITPNPSNGLLEPQDAYDIQATISKFGPVFTGLRTKDNAIGAYGPITYIEYDTGERELYNLWADPLELNNIYLSTSSVLKSKLSEWLASLRHASGKALREAEETSP